MQFACNLVALRATPEVQARIGELAERCNQGMLTDAEQAEYRSFVQAIHLLSVLQVEARKVIRNGENG